MALSILIMVRAPRPGEVRRALQPLLGAERCAALQSELIRQAVSWARDLAPGAVHVAHEPPDAARELAPLTGHHVTSFPQNGDGIARRLADAVARVYSRREGALIVLWPDLPCLRPLYGRAAAQDLADGCDLVLGPTIDGGFYLIGISRPLPALFALPEQAWRSPEALNLAVGAAREDEAEIGLLRAERGLHRPADVRAALADPLLPASLRSLLTPAPRQAGAPGKATS